MIFWLLLSLAHAKEQCLTEIDVENRACSQACLYVGKSGGKAGRKKFQCICFEPVDFAPIDVRPPMVSTNTEPAPKAESSSYKYKYRYGEED